MNQWRPLASNKMLIQRASILRQIREFFFERQVVEVDTPAIMPHTVTDPYMTALSLEVCGHVKFLQTSPEYAMKRLLAAGMRDIYQLSHQFRADEKGSKHQPEFMLLEWYRQNWDHFQLMDEVFSLVSEITQCSERENWTYQNLFVEKLGIDPFLIEIEELKVKAESLLGWLPNDLLFDDYLSLLFAEKIEPHLGDNSIVFVYDFPASQASLAKLLPDNSKCAARFEVYAKGIELANGFWELTDYKEQEKRFVEDNEKRLLLGYPQVAIDDDFLNAIKFGLPNCSGVALGVDRLLMITHKKLKISDVIPFGV